MNSFATCTTNGYRVVEGFFKRPPKVPFVEVPDVAVDQHDNIYVLNRGPYPVMVFDTKGQCVATWGDYSERYFTIPHGIHVDHAGLIYTADIGNHTIRKWTADGRLLLMLGRPHLNSAPFSGEPFNKPTHVCTASNGDIFVSDGYYNAKIHCFDPEGALKYSWGAQGNGPGEFNVAHSIYIDQEDNDRVYVSDRYSNRVQVFDRDGGFVAEWTGLELPNSVRKGHDGNFYVAELQHRISILDSRGGVLKRWGGDGVDVDDTQTGLGGAYALPDAPSRNPVLVGKVVREPGAGLFSAPHGIAGDSKGSIYVGEVSESFSGLDRGDRCVQKFELVA